LNPAIIFGTRPEIIKLSPIINKLNKKNSTVIFTGQHYDFEMGLRFIKELGIRKPDYHIRLNEKPKTNFETATQMGEIVSKLAKIIALANPDSVIVQGDTNTVLAGTIAAIKFGIPVSHVESGLRSYDWRMPEEHNRIATDHLSELLFAPTNVSKKILQQEKVHGRIFVTGNTSIDAIEENIKKAQMKRTIDIKDEDFILATIHRAENVDNNKTLLAIMNALLKSKSKIILPLHPRTAKRLKNFGLYNKIKDSKLIRIIGPVGYFDMIYLMQKCKFIITDSGGIQEEATSPKIRKKVIVIRKTTDRPEAVTSGHSDLIGTDQNKIIHAINQTEKNSTISSSKNPYGSGNASKKIISILRKNL